MAKVFKLEVIAQGRAVIVAERSYEDFIKPAVGEYYEVQGLMHWMAGAVLQVWHKVDLITRIDQITIRLEPVEVKDTPLAGADTPKKARPVTKLKPAPPPAPAQADDPGFDLVSLKRRRPGDDDDHGRAA